QGGALSVKPGDLDALRVLIADDERLARQRLRRLLSDIPGIEIAGEAERGEAVVEASREGEIDVLLLDIAMPGMSGVEAIRLLPEPAPYVIFCTAHAEHAVSAFEVGAVDYLLKPVDAARLGVAIERARRFFAPRPPEVPNAVTLKRLPIETREGVVLLD